MRDIGLALLLVLAVGTGCSDEARCRGSDRIEASINRLIASGSVHEFSLPDVASFPWDRMFLFIEYTSAESIGAATKLKFPSDFLSSEMGHVPENKTLIVFATDLSDSPTCYETVANPSADSPGGFLFDGPSHRSEGLTRGEASFRILRGGRAAELQLLRPKEG